MQDGTTGDGLTVADGRREPFVRMEPATARLAAEALAARAMEQSRLAREAFAAHGDPHAGAYNEDRAEDAQRLADYLNGWADAWDPQREEMPDPLRAPVAP